MAVLASVQHDDPALRPSLDRLARLVESDMGRVNTLIIQRMHSSVGLIPELAGHIIAAGGKRIRPMLTLAAAQLSGYGGPHHIGLAAAVEFIHTATLLHDDVVDESDLRRGLASANALWGNKASVLVGDFLFSRAFELMVEAGSLEVLGILSHAAAVIAEGEVQQLTTSNDTQTTERAYLDVIRGKTAQLFAAAARVGAVIAERPAGEADALESYGMNIGIAFQLVDDVLDYSARQAELGKTVGDDFREGKLTLPVIIAFERGDEAERSFWRRTLEELEQRDGDLAEAVTLMERHQALAESLGRARHYAEMARSALLPFPDQPIKRALLDAVDFTVQRAY